MNPRRRTVLVALGSVGLAGGSLTYWQRRRIRRRGEVDDIEAARDIAVPSIAEPVSVSSAHVEAAHERVYAHLQETETILGSEPASYNQDRLARARDGLDANAPENATDDSERLDALESYRLALARSATARGWHFDDEPPASEELQERYDALGSEIDAFESSYRGESLTETVVQSGEADSSHSRAQSRYNRAPRFLDDEELANAVAWEIVELGRFRLFNAEWLLRDQEGPDRRETLRTRFDELVEWTEARTEDVRWNYDEAIRTEAAYRWTEARLGGGTDPEEHLAAGRPALAVREQASLAVVAATLSAFEDVPSQRDLDEVDDALIEDASELITAKQTAVDEIEATLDGSAGDPLVRYLLGEARYQVENSDRRLGRLLSDVRSASEGEWRIERDRAFLSYREAGEIARAVPKVIQLIDE